MYNIILGKKAVKYINSCPLKHQAQLKSKILSLKNDPKPIDVKSLKGFNPYLRVDIGEYRIIYKIEDKTIIIIIVGKRNDNEVYKLFKRQF